MDEIILHQHPDGDGQLEYIPGALVASNDLDATVAVVRIGPAGLRAVAARLLSLADLTEMGARDE